MIEGCAWWAVDWARRPAMRGGRVGRNFQIVCRPGRHRWGVWTDAQWHATPRELAARGDRYSHPEQWGWIGDQMFALAAYLSPRVAGQRHRFRKHLTLLADRPYKRDVLALTADLITRRHWLIFVSWQIRPLTAAEVKRRIIKRRPRP